MSEDQSGVGRPLSRCVQCGRTVLDVPRESLMLMRHRVHEGETQFICSTQCAEALEVAEALVPPMAAAGSTILVDCGGSQQSVHFEYAAATAQDVADVLNAQLEGVVAEVDGDSITISSK